LSTGSPSNPAKDTIDSRTVCVAVARCERIARCNASAVGSGRRGSGQRALGMMTSHGKDRPAGHYDAVASGRETGIGNTRGAAEMPQIITVAATPQ
jgi:hypothetical protein